MKQKRIILFILVVLLGIYFLPLKKCLAAEKNPSISFDKTLVVDKRNYVIKYLKEGTTVANLLNKITVNNGSVAVYDKSNLEKTSGKMKTSDKLVVLDTGNVLYREYTISVLGDVSGDSNVNIHDVNRLFRYYKNKYELSSESVEAGNVKMTGGYNIITKDDFVVVGKEKTFQEIDYGISPKGNAEITLADVAKLYQYSQGKIELIDVGAWTGVSDDKTIVNTTGSIVKGVNKGTVNVNITGETSNDTGSIVIKSIPDVEPINLTSRTVMPYQTNIILQNELRNKQTGMQDFDIVNLRQDNETYYFVTAYYSLYSGRISITSQERHDALTTMIYKVNKNNLNNSSINNVAAADIMYVKNAGQGQWIAKEQNNNFFWTSGSGEIICSGDECNSNVITNDGRPVAEYSCIGDTTTDDNDEIDCTWWGGDNSDVSRIGFSPNSFDDDVSINQFYRYESNNNGRVAMWATFDWNNNLMAVINGPLNKVIVYDAQKATQGILKVIYEFTLPRGNNDVKNSYSTQGYAISGGYIYRLRGNYKQGIWIEQFNVLGEYVGYRRVDTGQEISRAESQGMKIYNNQLFFGIIYRNGCNLYTNGVLDDKKRCTTEQMGDVRNSIYYLK